MLDTLASLGATQTVSVAHQAIRILRHFSSVPVARRPEAVQGMNEVLDEGSTSLALAVVDEIERREGATLVDLPDQVLDRYASELADLAEHRTREQFDPDAERGRRVLDSLRALY